MITNKTFTDVKSPASPYYKDLIKTNLAIFNQRLFNNRQNLYKDKLSSDLYEETISISTDILFLLMGYQRNLISESSIIKGKFDLEIASIKKALAQLGNYSVLNEEWNQEVITNLNEIINIFNKMSETNEVYSTDLLGILVEDSWEKNLLTEKASKNGASINRRGKGSYYTKDELIDIIVKETIDRLCRDKSIEEVLNLKILDPAVGSGAFLVGTLKRLIDIIQTKSEVTLSQSDINLFKKKIVENCLFGVDLNKNALRAAIYSLWIEVGCKEFATSLFEENFVEGDSLISNQWDIDFLYNKEVDLEALEATNYFVAGKQLQGELIEDWLSIYREISNQNSSFFEKTENLDTLLQGRKSKSFIWQLRFKRVYTKQKGFNAVIGNPPWNKVKAHKKEFFEHFDIKIKGMQGTSLDKYIKDNFLSKLDYKQLWEDHKNEIKAYSNAINLSNYFKHQSKTINGVTLGGDRDLYKYFLELSYTLTQNNGIVGLILPAALTQSEGTTGLRELLFNKNQIELLFTIENRDKIFPIDSRFKYALLIFRKRVDANENITCGFMMESIQALQETINQKQFIHFPQALINILSPNYKTLPDIKTEYELNIIKKIYDAHPLINSENGWKMKFFRELDMTNDSNLFIHKNDIPNNYDRSEYIPLYEGRMVHQFDFSAKKYIEGEGRQAKWEDLPWEEKVLAPHYYVKAEDAEKKFPSYIFTRPCFCDIAGQTNERAVQTALIPSRSIAGNKVPTVKIEPNSIIHNLIWIAITNSFIFDWLMRLRISTTINYFHWNQMPMPIIDIRSGLAQELVHASAKLSLISTEMRELNQEIEQFYSNNNQEIDLNPCINPIERQHLRAKIDAIVAQLYGINVHELAYILHQFPLIDRSQPVLNGDKSIKKSNKEASYITRDLILHSFLVQNNLNTRVDIVEIYQRCQINIEPLTGKIRNINERVKNALDFGSIAYIPG